MTWNPNHTSSFYLHSKKFPPSGGNYRVFPDVYIAFLFPEGLLRGFSCSLILTSHLQIYRFWAYVVCFTTVFAKIPQILDACQKWCGLRLPFLYIGVCLYHVHHIVPQFFALADNVHVMDACPVVVFLFIDVGDVLVFQLVTIVVYFVFQIE